MTTVAEAVALVLPAQRATNKPLAIILAGHNGSGKSTLWELNLADVIQIPLINADRMMMSILPERNKDGYLPAWASNLRDNDRGWMAVAQTGVISFVGQALGANVPFAMETVFSHWRRREDGSYESKIDLIREFQGAGYFVLLIFVGLTSEDLSVLRVQSRAIKGGHTIDEGTLRARFGRTQRAVAEALEVADASILTDNSRSEDLAFTVCRVQSGANILEDIRDGDGVIPSVIANWLDRVAPRRREG